MAMIFHRFIILGLWAEKLYSTFDRAMRCNLFSRSSKKACLSADRISASIPQPFI
jgi:hypothetical protein